MCLNASEMGLTESEFWGLSFAEYMWMWFGYLRRIEREDMQGVREIVSIIYNTNVKRGKQKTARRLMPLTIDPKIKVKTAEEIKAIHASIPSNWWGNDKDN